MVNTTEKSPLEQQLVGLGTLLQLEKQSRHARSEQVLGFLIVNETLRLVNYRQAVLCRRRPSGKIKIQAVSQVDLPDRNAPYVLWLRRVLASLFKKNKPNEPLAFTIEEIPKHLQKEWQEWSAPHALWCPLEADDLLLGGIWLTRDTPWEPSEIALLTQLADAYAHDWLALLQRPPWWRRRTKESGGRRLFKWLIIILALASLALPVRLSVLAPAQVAAVDPIVVSAPLQGVIKKFHILPNQNVKTGQLLFSLDDTDLRNQYEVAKKALAVMRAEYQRARQQSLVGGKGASDVDLLKAKVASKLAEVDYAAEQLAMVTVRSEREGIAVFEDINDWLGKPVVTGEKVLILADPQKTELEIQVPIDNAINMKPDAEIRLFLNIDPSRYFAAKVRQAGYEAKVTPDNILAFRVKAAFEPETPPLRIGLRGTAKIYGKETRLYYYLLRRPMAALRKTIGL